MNWKMILMVASGVTLGTAGTFALVYGFNPLITLVFAVVALFAATLMSFVMSLGKEKQRAETDSKVTFSE